MPKHRPKYGRAVAPIIDEATGEVLGWTHEWDDGETSRIMAADVHPRLAREHDPTGAPQG